MNKKEVEKNMKQSIDHSLKNLKRLMAELDFKSLNFILENCSVEQKKSIFQYLFTENKAAKKVMIDILLKCSIQSLAFWLEGQSLDTLMPHDKTELIKKAIQRNDIDRLRFFKEKRIDITAEHIIEDAQKNPNLPLLIVITETLFYFSVEDDKSYRTEMLDFYLNENGSSLNDTDFIGRSAIDFISLKIEPNIFKYYVKNKNLDINKLSYDYNDILVNSLKDLAMHFNMGNKKTISDIVCNITNNLQYIIENNIIIQDIDSLDVLKNILYIKESELFKVFFNFLKDRLNISDQQDILQTALSLANYDIVTFLFGEFNREIYKDIDLFNVCLSALRIKKSSPKVKKLYNTKDIWKSLLILKNMNNLYRDPNENPFKVLLSESYDEYMGKIFYLLQDMKFDSNAVLEDKSYNQDSLMDDNIDALFKQERAKKQNNELFVIMNVNGEEKKEKKRL